MSRNRTKTKTEERLELGRRLAAVASVAHNMEIDVWIDKPRGKNPGYVEVRKDINEVYSEMTETCARRVTDNPLLYAESCDAGSPEYQNIVRALRSGCGIFFDWINPQDVDRLAEEAAQSYAHSLEVNRRFREETAPRYVVTRGRIIPGEEPEQAPIKEIVARAYDKGEAVFVVKTTCQLSAIGGGWEPAYMGYWDSGYYYGCSDTIPAAWTLRELA